MEDAKICLSLLEILGYVVVVFMSGAGIGFLFGRLARKMESSTKTSKKQAQEKKGTHYVSKTCDTLSQNKRSLLYTFYDVQITYIKDKPITNTCPSLQGEKCKYTSERCYLL